LDFEILENRPQSGGRRGLPEPLWSWCVCELDSSKLCYYFLHYISIIKPACYYFNSLPSSVWFFQTVYIALSTVLWFFHTIVLYLFLHCSRKIWIFIHELYSPPPSRFSQILGLILPIRLKLLRLMTEFLILILKITGWYQYRFWDFNPCFYLSSFFINSWRCWVTVCNVNLCWITW